jgi:hypothetical protein
VSVGAISVGVESLAVEPVASGGVNSFSYTASGGITFAGASPKIATRVNSAAGGLTFAGTAAELRARVAAPAGGLVFSGASTTAFHESTRVVSAFGGIMFSGVSVAAFVTFGATSTDRGGGSKRLRARRLLQAPELPQIPARIVEIPKPRVTPKVNPAPAPVPELAALDAVSLTDEVRKALANNEPVVATAALARPAVPRAQPKVAPRTPPAPEHDEGLEDFVLNALLH